MRIEAVSYVYPERPEGSVEQLLVTRDRDEVDTAWTIQDVDLDVPAGRSLALVGATGSGKSTLALLLVRLADPQRGRVCLAGIDLREISDVELRRRVQLVPQEPFLFVGSIAENLRRGRAGASDAKLSAAITRLGLEDWISGLPSGLDTQVGERGSGLSAGERQLVALLRAEVMGPDVLILDEATSSVDAAMEARLARTIEVLAQGRTMVVIAHRLSTAARSDRIAVMAHGRLVQTGTHAELVDAEGPYAHIASEWTKGVRV